MHRSMFGFNCMVGEMKCVKVKIIATRNLIFKKHFCYIMLVGDAINALVKN